MRNAVFVSLLLVSVGAFAFAGVQASAQRAPHPASGHLLPEGEGMGAGLSTQVEVIPPFPGATVAPDAELPLMTAATAPLELGAVHCGNSKIEALVLEPVISAYRLENRETLADIPAQLLAVVGCRLIDGEKAEVILHVFQPLPDHQPCLSSSVSSEECSPPQRAIGSLVPAILVPVNLN